MYYTHRGTNMCHRDGTQGHIWPLKLYLMLHLGNNKAKGKKTIIKGNTERQISVLLQISPAARGFICRKTRSWALTQFSLLSHWSASKPWSLIKVYQPNLSVLTDPAFSKSWASTDLNYEYSPLHIKAQRISSWLAQAIPTATASQYAGMQVHVSCH